MASEVGVCNLGVNHINAYPFESFEDRQKEARQCKLIYESLRDEVLAAFDWSFARKRATLSLNGDSVDDWDYVYQWPIDCLEPRKISTATGYGTSTVYNDSTGLYDTVGEVEFEIGANSSLNERAIMTDQEGAVLIYTAKVTDANMFSPTFVTAFSYRIAAALAVSVKGDQRLKETMYNLYLRHIGSAQAGNANAGFKKPDNSSSFTRAR